MRETVRLKQAAYELNVSTSTLRRMIRAGKIPAQKIGLGGRTSPLIVKAEDIAKRR